MKGVREYPYEPARRKVPFLVYAIILLPIGLLWRWVEKGEPSLLTVTLVALGLHSLSQGIGRLYIMERAISQDLRTMKEEKP